MLVRAINGGDFAADSLIYRPLNNSVINYLQTNMNNAFQMLGNTCQNFVDATKALYNKFNSDEVINRAKLIAVESTVHLDPMAVHYCDYNGLPSANIAMQRYIMAYPEMNKLYNRNSCYGYQETYIDPEPNLTGEDRLDYGKVMDGIVQYDSDDNPYILQHTFDKEEDRLDIYQQIAIMRTWDNVAKWIAERKDPSDPSGEGEL